MYFGGTVVGEQAMKSEDEVGSLVEYEFRVSCSSGSFYYRYWKLAYTKYGLKYVIFINSINKYD